MSQGPGGQGAAPMPAVVLAGSRTQKPFFEGDTPGYKALTPLLGRPMIEWTVDAVEGAPGVTDLLVVAPNEVGRALAEHPRVTVVPDHGGFLANILAGLEAAEGERVLFVNCDVPLTRPEMIEHFLQHAPADPDVVVSAVEQGSLAKLPQAPGKPFRRFAVCLRMKRRDALAFQLVLETKNEILLGETVGRPALIAQQIAHGAIVLAVSEPAHGQCSQTAFTGPRDLLPCLPHLFVR